MLFNYHVPYTHNTSRHRQAQGSSGGGCHGWGCTTGTALCGLRGLRAGCAGHARCKFTFLTNLFECYLPYLQLVLNALQIEWDRRRPTLVGGDNFDFHTHDYLTYYPC